MQLRYCPRVTIIAKAILRNVDNVVNLFRQIRENLDYFIGKDDLKRIDLWSEFPAVSEC